MARIRRIIAPGFPHHVTQRGNRRELVFFEARRPLGPPEFVATLEKQLRRTLRLRKRGRKPKVAEGVETLTLFPEPR